MKSISFLITLAMLFLVCTAASATDNDTYRQKVEALRSNPKIVKPEEIISLCIRQRGGSGVFSLWFVRRIVFVYAPGNGIFL